MSVSFLLGAGVSVPIIQVRTKDITERVLTGQDVIRHSDSLYYYDEGLAARHEREHEPVTALVRFLKRLQEDQDRFYSTECLRVASDGCSPVNHEDLAYACDLIAGSVSGELENPVLEPYIQSLTGDVNHWWSDAFGLAARDRDKVGKVAAEGLGYIEDVAAKMLSRLPDTDTASRVHRVLLGACRDSTVDTIDVCTLNQDLVLEALLQHHGIAFVDGFEFDGTAAQVKRWNPDLFEHPRERREGAASVHLLKLHGSVDWYRLRLPDGDWHHDFVGRVARGADVDRLECASGGHLENPGWRPLLLVGVFNKIMAYTTYFFVDLFAAFWRSLRRASDLVVSGYSFRDKGVNSRLTDWISQRPQGSRRLIVIHRDPSSLRDGARGAIRNNWDRWLANGVLRLVERDIQDCDWSDVRPLVGSLEDAGSGNEVF